MTHNSRNLEVAPPTNKGGQLGFYSLRRFFQVWGRFFLSSRIKRQFGYCRTFDGWKLFQELGSLTPPDLCHLQNLQLDSGKRHENLFGWLDGLPRIVDGGGLAEVIVELKRSCHLLQAHTKMIWSENHAKTKRSQKTKRMGNLPSLGMFFSNHSHSDAVGRSRLNMVHRLRPLQFAVPCLLTHDVLLPSADRFTSLFRLVWCWVEQ